MSKIVLEHVSKVYPGDVRAVDDVSLTIDSGEFMVLVGPSGCGKSTLLRMIAGLEDITEGTVAIGERDVTHLAPRHRDIAMVFQNYALYPHMSVRKNLAYGLKVRKTPGAEIDRRVGDVAKMLGLEPYLDRRPANLSGGQRQRVAMGRAIVREPAAYLMDEPLSNLDAKLRVGMRAELSRLHDRLGTTTVYVTHDQTEAMTLGQRVTVMKDGVIQQVGEPQVLYREPANLFVAAFIGSPSMNLVEATVAGDIVEFAGFRLELGHPPARSRRHRHPRYPAGRFRGREPRRRGAAGGRRRGCRARGARRRVARDLLGRRHARGSRGPEGRSRRGGAPQLLADDQRSLFTASVDPRTTARPGGRMRLAVDPRAFHFFDPSTGETLRMREGDLAGATI